MRNTDGPFIRHQEVPDGGGQKDWHVVVYQECQAFDLSIFIHHL